MSAHQQIVEHIVLLSVKPDIDYTKVENVGKILQSTSTSPNFSHIIHCRFRSTDDLQTYNQHPKHLSVLKNTQPLLDDFIVVDFLSNRSCDSLKPGSAMRVTLLKLKEDLVEHEKGKLVEELKSQFKRTDDIRLFYIYYVWPGLVRTFFSDRVFRPWHVQGARSATDYNTTNHNTAIVHKPEEE
ncbi:putative stress responsive alpha-beta barrel [Helianthus anomalus]